MATDDQQVLVTGQEAAPASFRIPGNGQIEPKAVFASFHGASAGTPYLPALKITSDGGELVGVYPTCNPIAAGGSAIVSWFPDVDPCCGSSSSGGGGTIDSVTSPQGTLTVASPSGPAVRVDMPATGVTAATYGDGAHVAQVAVDAEGRITAASNIAIAGGGGGLVNLFDSTLAAPATSIDTGAGGVPGGYSGLMIYCTARRADAVSSATLDLIVNNDTGANYDQLVTDNSTGVMTPSWAINQVAGKICEIPGSNIAANVFAYATVWIPNYTNTLVYKAWTSSGGFVSNAVDAEFVTQASQWRNTAAITRLAMQPGGGVNLLTGSRMTIYGLP